MAKTLADSTRPDKLRATLFQMYRAKDGWRWRAVRGNGEIVADGAEAYTRKTDVHRAVKDFINCLQWDSIRVEWGQPS